MFSKIIILLSLFLSVFSRKLSKKKEIKQDNGAGKENCSDLHTIFNELKRTLDKKAQDYIRIVVPYQNSKYEYLYKPTIPKFYNATCVNDATNLTLTGINIVILKTNGLVKNEGKNKGKDYLVDFDYTFRTSFSIERKLNGSLNKPVYSSDVSVIHSSTYNGVCKYKSFFGYSTCSKDEINDLKNLVNFKQVLEEEFKHTLSEFVRIKNI